MSILKYKYKAHKIINYAFYLVVFIMGFLLGFGTKKIDFNKLISQFLMIDNVSALEYNAGGVSITEDYIYDVISSRYSDFNFEDFPYVAVTVVKSSGTINFVALSEDTFNADNVFTIVSDYKALVSLIDITPGYFIYNRYTPSTDSYTYNRYSATNNPLNINYMTTGFELLTSSSSKSISFTNFDVPGASDKLNSTLNVLDFSKYSVNLEFNENLFKDNPNFKEVCVPNNKKFGIISKEYNVDENIIDETLNNRYYVDRDYIWFPNGVKGLSTFFYHNKSENNVKLIDKDDASYSMYGYWYWLNSKEEIDKYFGELPTSAMLSEAGYTDKYKYYNYTMHPFLIRYIGYEDDYMFNVFWFKELGVNYIDSDIVDYPEDYCFYIKNKYDVVLLNTNEWGDLYTDITILGDKDITISTSKNQADVNNVGMFSVVNNFIQQIKSTVIFINTNIHNLFLSMPLIVRMFILSVFTIFIIKFIIDMLVR